MFYSKYFVILTILSTIFLLSQDVDADNCTITRYNADAILFAERHCTEIVLRGLSVPAGETLDLTHLKKGAKVIFEGTFTWGYKEWSGPLIHVSGTDVKISGASGHLLDGRGHLWWDGQGTNGGKAKPKFFTATKMYNSKITNINIKNSPVHVFTINQCDGVTLEEVVIDVKDGDTQGGHNTDGFDIVASNNVVIRHSNVYSQDDCLAVKSGTNYVFSDSVCGGGHGLSIGGVGNATVKSVRVYNCRVENSLNGIRIKTVYGAVGSVSNVTYEDITLKNITGYGIIIEGDYLNGGPTGQATDGIPITDLTLKNISGSVQKVGTNVYVLVKRASNWHCSGIKVTGGENHKKCEGIPQGAGISC